MDSLVAMPRDNEGRLDGPPPRPNPMESKALMSMGSAQGSGIGAGMNNPAVKAMAAMGAARKNLLDLAVLLPGMSDGIRQVISGLETSVPEQIAALIGGNPIGPSPDGSPI